jgi:hypothetical protein
VEVAYTNSWIAQTGEFNSGALVASVSPASVYVPLAAAVVIVAVDPDTAVTL